MMTGIRAAIAFVISMIAIPMMMGLLAMTFTERKKNIANTFLLGLLMSQMFHQLIAVPCVFLQVTLHRTTGLYYACMVGAVLVGCLLRKNKVWEVAKEVFHFKKFSRWWDLYAGFIIVQVMLLTMVTIYIYGDDKTYIAYINDMLSSNILYGNDPYSGATMDFATTLIASRKLLFSVYYPWLAGICWITGLHPLILCKSVLIVYMLPLAYVCNWLYAKLFFPENEGSRIKYMYYLMLGFVAGIFSWYTVSFRMYTWIWHNKAWFAVIVMPVALVVFTRSFLVEYKKNDVFCMLICVFASCHATMSGTFVIMMALAAMTFLGTIKQKSVKVAFAGIIALMPAITYFLLMKLC